MKGKGWSQTIIIYFSTNKLFVLSFFHLNSCKTPLDVLINQYTRFYSTIRKTQTEKWRNLIFTYICRTEGILGDSRQPHEEKWERFMLNMCRLTKKRLLGTLQEIGLNPSHTFYINARGNQGCFVPSISPGPLNTPNIVHHSPISSSNYLCWTVINIKLYIRVFLFLVEPDVTAAPSC